MSEKNVIIEKSHLIEAHHHPYDKYLREGRIPHIFCPGCGLGSTMQVLIEAIIESGVDLDNVSVVSGIGCSGRISGYLNFDSFHTTHGRAIPFAIGLSVTDPDRKVIVVTGDGDLAAIGGNHFIHAARRNADITVICMNNFNYGMTGGQVGPTSFVGQVQTTTPYGNIENPFNLPGLAAACGAVYVARWTAINVRRMKKSFIEAIKKRGFSFVEVVSECPTTFGRRNRLPDGKSIAQYFQEHTVLKHGADPQSVHIRKDGDIVIGKFVDKEGVATLTEHLLAIQRLASTSTRRGL